MRTPWSPLAVLLAAGTLLGAPAPDARGEDAEPDRAARLVARALAEAIVARDAESAAALCTTPTNLDGDVAETEPALVEAWRRALDRRSLRGVRIVSVEVMPMEQARRRFGPPPSRLGELPTEGALVAILRLDRTQLVAVLSRVEDRWTVIAVTD